MKRNSVLTTNSQLSMAGLSHQNTNRSMTQTLCGSIRSIDNFGRHFVMKLDGDKAYMQSYMGSILTLLLKTTVLFYAAVKIRTILTR